MAIPAFFLQNSIARIESTSVAVENGNVVYTFRNHNFVNSRYNGIVMVKLLALPTGTAGTEPVVFNSGNGNAEVTNFGGTALTASDILGSGVHLFYYDSDSRTLQFIA